MGGHPGETAPFHYLVDAMSTAVSPQGSISGIWMPLLTLAGFTILILGAAWTFRWDAEHPAGWKQGSANKAASM